MNGDLLFALGLPLDFHRFLLAFFMIMPRFGVVLLYSAFISRGSVYGLARAAITVSLIVFGVPIVYDTTLLANDLGIVFFVALVLKELFIGICISYLISLSFAVVETAGFYIDNQRGASLSGIMNPFSGMETSPLGMLFMQLAVYYFFVSGLFLDLLGLMYNSYMIFSPFAFWPVFDIGNASRWFDTLEFVAKHALLISFPILGAMLIVELSLAIVSRFAPQLNVFFLSMPLKSGVAFLVLIPYVSVLLRLIYDLLLQQQVFFDSLTSFFM